MSWPSITEIGRTQVLITVGGPDSSGPIDLEQIRSHLLPLAGVGELFITSVPRGKPLTRKQYNISAQHWPTHFYENKRSGDFCVMHLGHHIPGHEVRPADHIPGY